MGWVKRSKAEDPHEHECALPSKPSIARGGTHKKDGTLPAGQSGPEPDGEIGDIWRCDDCGLLWQIWSAPAPGGRRGVLSTKTWRRATWFARLLYGQESKES